MGEVTDPNLLRMLNGDAAAPASGPRYGPPPKAAPPPTQLQLNADARATNSDARSAAADARAAAAADRATAEYNATHNPDGSKKAAPTDLKVIPQGSVTAIQENRHNLDMLGHSLEVLRSRPGSVGPGTGMLGDTFTQFNDPGGTEVRRAIGQIGAIKIHDLSGAAVSASEAPRFMPFVPAVTDRPDVARQKLEGFQREMAAYLREQEGFYADPANGYLAYKGPGASPTATPTQDDFAQNDQNGLTGMVHADQQSSTQTPPPPPGGDPLSLDTIALGLKQGAGSVVQGIGDTVGIAANPIGQMLYNATGYGDQRYDAGTALREGLGLPQNPNQTADTMIRAGTGGLMFGGAARSLAELVNPGIWQNGLRVVGAQPATDAAAGVAGGYGADQARQAGYGPGVQTLAALALGAPVAGVSAIANRAPRVASPIMQAADRQGITMMPADVGGTGTRMASAVTAKTLGGIPMAEAADNALVSAGNARNRVAADMGRISDETGAGQAAQRGARSFVQSSEDRATQIYDKISIPPKANAATHNTKAALEEITHGLDSNPELSAIWTGNPRLKATLEALIPEDRGPINARVVETKQAVDAATEAVAQADAKVRTMVGQRGYSGLRMDQIGEGDIRSAQEGLTAAQKALTGAQKAHSEASAAAAKPPRVGTVSWEDMKRLRSIAGQIVGKPGLSSDGAAEAAMRKFYGALSADMEETAARTSPRALTEFRRATQFFRGRQNRIDNVLSGILGNDLGKGESAAFEQINHWAQQHGGDFKRLSQAMRSLPADEAGEVRASLFARMGRAPKGQQNADGLQFSPATFSTQWAGLSNRAKSVLFPNAEHRAAINDIVRVMDGMKRAGQYSNYSNTGLIGNASAHIVGLLTHPFVTAGVAAGEYSAGKLLASPKFARWLAKVPATNNPSALKAYIGRLGTIASEDALIASDARGLQQRLQNSFSQSPSRAAAEDKKQD